MGAKRRKIERRYKKEKKRWKFCLAYGKHVDITRKERTFVDSLARLLRCLDSAVVLLAGQGAAAPKGGGGGGGKTFKDRKDEEKVTLMAK